ncbi:MAG: hypothetical protein ACTHOL_18585 [Luteibacter jiangsuensis]
MDLMTRPTQLRAIGLCLCAAWTASAPAATHYLLIINDDDRAVVMVQVAPADAGAFEPLDLPRPLIGGREGQATVAVPPGPCLRDLRIVYRDTSTLTLTAWNTCRQSTVHVGASRHAGLRQRHPD